MLGLVAILSVLGVVAVALVLVGSVVSLGALVQARRAGAVQQARGVCVGAVERPAPSPEQVHPRDLDEDEDSIGQEARTELLDVRAARGAAREASIALGAEPQVLALIALDISLSVKARREAALSLARVGSPWELPEVGLALFPEPAMRQAALSLILASGADRSAPVLIDLLDALPDPVSSEVALDLVDALVAAGSVRAVPALRRLEDRLPAVQVQLKRALWSAVRQLQGQGHGADLNEPDYAVISA